MVIKAPEPTHGVESEIERQLVMRPVAAITTARVGTANIIEGADLAQGFGHTPAPVLRGPLGAFVTS